VWEIELTQNRGPLANVFEKCSVRRLAEENLRAGITGTGGWKDFVLALPEKDLERQKQAKLHQIQREMRQEIAAKRKTQRELKQQKPPAALVFIRQELDEYGTQIISRYVGRYDKPALVERWRRDKKRYPFLTSSLEGQLFSSWYAMVEHNKAIDANAHVDVEVLSCLNRADAIVTADTRFQKDAFDVLWHSKGKLLFSPDDFVKHLELLRS
jgi:hypothetical protein